MTKKSLKVVNTQKKIEHKGKLSPDCRSLGIIYYSLTNCKESNQKKNLPFDQTLSLLFICNLKAFPFRCLSCFPFLHLRAFFCFTIFFHFSPRVTSSQLIYYFSLV